MADPKEPKKETVRITLPPRVTPSPAEAAGNTRDTVKINLPSRPPANSMEPNRHAPAAPSPAPPGSPRLPVSQPSAPPKPVAPRPFLPPPISSSSATSAPRSSFAPSAPFAAGMPAMETELVSSGPKKETARMTILPDPPKVSGSVQMKKTQPLINMPAATAPVTPVNVAPKEAAPKVDAISMPLCWALLGTSAAILLIQIWNYLS
jgi:hypothetical protein